MKKVCEICEQNHVELFPCDIGLVPKGGLYFCAKHFMEHLRTAHGFSGEEAAVALARRKERNDD